MKISLLLIPCSLIVLAVSEAEFAVAQQGQQIPGGATGGAAGGAAGAATAGGGGGLGAGAGAGGTTEGFGGATTQGAGQGGGGGQGLAGTNIAEGFAGAANTQGFVGGGRAATTNVNTNRQFRGITGGTVPTGGGQQQTGNPRQVPVSLRLGFARPARRDAEALTPDNVVSLKRYAVRRPELSGLEVTLAADGVATITGVAEDNAARLLAVNLVRLQPGVRSIQNRALLPAQ